jgi:hypothetical protein
LLWRWDNAEGIGDVFVYPLVETPYRSEPLFLALHAVMRLLHLPLVLLALVGVGLLGWRSFRPRLAPANHQVARELVALLGGSTLVFVLTVAVGRYAVPLHPWLYCLALLPLGGARDSTADTMC